MSAIEHTRGDITLTRNIRGWHFVVANQHSEAAEPQEILLTKKSAVEDLKAVIGQVEHAAKVLNGEREG